MHKENTLANKLFYYNYFIYQTVIFSFILSFYQGLKPIIACNCLGYRLILYSSLVNVKKQAQSTRSLPFN